MLQSYPTKKGTGIAIFGDWGDLKTLYETVHEIAKSLDENNNYLKAQSQLLMNFAYEIRKAYSKQRLIKKFKFDGDETEVNYYGFNCVWTDILIFIATLRHNAGFIQVNKLQQSYLYMLESIVEESLFQYDPEGAYWIQPYLGQRINITNKFAFILYQALHIKFVSEKAGKKRFKNIPLLIDEHFNEWSPIYKNLIHSLEISSREQNCEITDLEFDDSSDIKW